MSASSEFGWSYEATDEFKEELDKMVTVTESGTGGGYEWDEFFAYWHPERRRFFYVSASGCSCNSISDGIYSLDDFESVATKEELVAALKREKGGSYGWSRDDRLHTANVIMAFREA